MRPITKRHILNAIINGATFYMLAASGAGWWALVAVPHAIWNFYDGMTRGSLEDY